MNKHILNIFMLDKRKTDLLHKLDIFDGNKCLGFWCIADNCQLDKQQFFDYTQRVLREEFADFEPIIFIYDDYYFTNTMYEIFSNGTNFLSYEEIIDGKTNIIDGKTFIKQKYR